MPRGVYPRKARPPKQYPAEMVAQVSALYYGQGMSQAEVATALGTTQHVVFNVMRHHGLVTRARVTRDQRGPRNASWKGGTSISSGGYRLAHAPAHPRSGAEGYVFEHILVAEHKLGRSLVWRGPAHPETEIVHHLNGDKLDNRPENIAVTTYAEHGRIHNAWKRQQRQLCAV